MACTLSLVTTKTIMQRTSNFRLMIIHLRFWNFLSQLFLILMKRGSIKFNFLTSINYISQKLSPTIHYLHLHSSRMYFLLEMDNERNVLCCTKTWSKFRNKYEGWPWGNWTKLSRYLSLVREGCILVVPNNMCWFDNIELQIAIRNKITYDKPALSICTSCNK